MEGGLRLPQTQAGAGVEVGKVHNIEELQKSGNSERVESIEAKWTINICLGNQNSQFLKLQFTPANVATPHLPLSSPHRLGTHTKNKLTRLRQPLELASTLPPHSAVAPTHSRTHSQRGLSPIDTLQTSRLRRSGIFRRSPPPQCLDAAATCAP